jgi:hypothetical protein
MTAGRMGRARAWREFTAGQAAPIAKKFISRDLSPGFCLTHADRSQLKEPKCLGQHLLRERLLALNSGCSVWSLLSLRRVEQCKPADPFELGFYLFDGDLRAEAARLGSQESGVRRGVSLIDP